VSVREFKRIKQGEDKGAKLAGRKDLAKKMVNKGLRKLQQLGWTFCVNKGAKSEESGGPKWTQTIPCRGRGRCGVRSDVITLFGVKVGKRISKGCDIFGETGPNRTIVLLGRTGRRKRGVGMRRLYGGRRTEDNLKSSIFWKKPGAEELCYLVTRRRIVEMKLHDAQPIGGRRRNWKRGVSDRWGYRGNSKN